MISRIEQGDDSYPSMLLNPLGKQTPACLYAMGDPRILRIRNHLLGLICSIRCPGSIVIKTLDAVRMLRDTGVLFVGGFQSPMEKECLEILLRGKRQVILCAAKGLVGLRLGQKARQAIRESRMLV